MPSSVDLAAAYADSGVAEVLRQLDQELIPFLDDLWRVNPWVHRVLALWHDPNRVPRCECKSL